MEVTLAYFDGCPHWRQARSHLRVLGEEFPAMHVTFQVMATEEEAERTRFHGSPSIQVNGSDPFADSGAPYGLSCRVYQTPEGSAGSPALEQIREALAMVGSD